MGQTRPKNKVNYISIEQCKHKAKKKARCGRLQFNQSWKSETSLLITLKKQFRRHQNTLSPETETYNRSYNRSHAFLQETEGQKNMKPEPAKTKSH